MKVRVLLVDDHALFREALRMSLDLEPGITVVGEAWDTESALRLVGECQPEVVCMDISLPGTDGIAVTWALLAQSPRLNIIGLSAHSDPLLTARLRDAGAVGYVNKMDAGQELPKAIRSLSGKTAY